MAVSFAAAADPARREGACCSGEGLPTFFICYAFISEATVRVAKVEESSAPADGTATAFAHNGQSEAPDSIIAMGINYSYST